jgi:hypothetical protein
MDKAIIRGKAHSKSMMENGSEEWGTVTVFGRIS